MSTDPDQRVNFRHLRIFLAVFDCGSATAAAARCAVSQPAVTQALAKLERDYDCALFRRTSRGFLPTEMGQCLETRVRRAMARLDAALAAISAGLVDLATYPQIITLMAVSEARSFTLAAHKLGVAQPTVHRSISLLEKEAGKPLLDRSSHNAQPSRLCMALVQASRLALAELAQARSDLAEQQGKARGRLAIGAGPIPRAGLLPKALAAFRKTHSEFSVSISEGSYPEMLSALRSGALDLVVGTLGSMIQQNDIVSEHLFDDQLALVAGPDHPLLGRPVKVRELMSYPWLVAEEGTPARTQFNGLFIGCDFQVPSNVTETGSLLLMREMVQDGRHLACVSYGQAATEIDRGLVAPLSFAWPEASRPVGVTYRSDWVPTRAQAQFLQALRDAAGKAPVPSTPADGDKDHQASISTAPMGCEQQASM